MCAKCSVAIVVLLVRDSFLPVLPPCSQVEVCFEWHFSLLKRKQQASLFSVEHLPLQSSFCPNTEFMCLFKACVNHLQCDRKG